MRRDEERVALGLEDALGAVPVVDVPVEDREALDAELALQHPRGDRDVVDQAKAHRPIRLSVMARRAERGERVGRGTASHL